MRIDVTHMMVKHAGLPDWPFPPDGSADYNGYAQNQPEVHDVLRRWRAIADSYGRDIPLVGEVWVPDVGDLARYLRPDELTQAMLDLPDEARQDPIWRRSGGTEHGRDGCRVPLPWRPGGSSFGFGAAGDGYPSRIGSPTTRSKRNGQTADPH